MQHFGSIILETHPAVSDAWDGRIEDDADGWQKTTLWNPAAETGHGDYRILASVRQTEDATTQVRFHHEKGGVFGVVVTPQLTYILLPGSQVRLPDTQVDMPGELIQRKTSCEKSSLPSDVVPQAVTDQAMILGAGLASRFVPVSGDVTGYPKPGVPLVGEDSVIVTLARHLYRHGIRKIIVNTYYKPDVLKAQLDALTDLEFIYVDEDKPSGTAGGLLKALEDNRVDRQKPILIMQGDAVTDANITGLLEKHQDVQPLVTIGIKRVSYDQVSQMAIVVTDGSGADGASGYVSRFKEKPTLAEAGPSRLGSIGFYVLSPDVYAEFMTMGRQSRQAGPEFDYAMDFLPGLLQGHGDRSPIYAHLLEEPFYWSDIGRPDQYVATVRDIYAGCVGVALPENLNDYYEQGIIYWPGAKAAVEADRAVLKGNIIVLSNPV